MPSWMLSMDFARSLSVQELLHALSLAYCRNLMAKQEMSELGFGKESNMEASGQKVNERIDNQS